jgi:hypothetical protein
LVLQSLAIAIGLLTIAGCGGGWQGARSLLPEITVQPVSQTASVGQTATFTVAATSSAPVSYQWNKGGAPISGATSSSYTTPSTTTADNGSTFTATVSNVVGSVTTAPATLTVAPSTVPPSAPSITAQPINQTVTAGQAATFAVVASGTAPLTYQWSDNGAPVSGATSSSYTTPPTTTANTGSVYTAAISNAEGSTTTAPTTLTVLPAPPAITTQPANQTVAVGQPATFGAVATGTGPLTYQWSKDGTPIAGATSSTYTTPASSATDSGSVFTLTVTNAEGSVTSMPATLTVNTPPTITSPPASQTVIVGQPATFTAAATGTGPLTYQWTKNGVPISGATASSYTTPATSSGDNGAIYAVVVSNAAGSVTSKPATLTVNSTPPVITVQPASQNVCANGSTTLSVTATGATSYQWSLGGVPIPGATSATYVIPNTIPADAGNYSVTVTNPAGSVTSNVAKVVVGSTVTTNPASLSIFATQTATFSISVTGAPPFTYQWFLIPAGTSTGAAIAGATSSSYTTPPATTAFNGNQYYVTIGDTCGVGALTSSNATLTVTTANVPPTITTQPVGQTVSANGTTTFTVAASGPPNLTYQWYRIPAGSVAGVAVPGATSASYTVPSTATNTTNDQDVYYAVVQNPYGQAVSQPATLAVGSGVQLQIVNQPTTVYTNPGEPATYSVTATSSLPLTYQWYEAAPGSSTFTPISGATNSTYTQPSTSTSDTGSVFRCVVSNGITSSVTSGTASLFVGPPADIGDLCNTNWKATGNAIAQPGCSFQLTAATQNQHGEIVWPNLISTGNLQLSFTVTVSNPSSTPADGFAMVLGDPSLGATPTSIGATGQGLGAKGIPGLVLGFDTYRNVGDPVVPYLGVGRGETALWENPWTNVNTSIPKLAVVGSSVSHTYTVSLVQGEMTVTLDGSQVFSGKVTVPPVAYLYVTGSTGGSYEKTVISNLSATITAASN